MSVKLSSWEEAVVWLRNQPDKKELVSACFYDDPLLDAAKRYYISAEWRAVQALLKGKQGTALDLGAGRGISSYALARDDWEVHALEPNSSQIVGARAIRALAHEANLDIKVEQNWGESLPYQDATFDLVHGRQVLHHAQDLKQLCREAARVLKPGGILIATREHVISKHGDLPTFLAAHPLHNMYGGEHAYLLNEYLDAITESGLVIKNVFNPYQSDINLFPETTQSLKKNLARRFRCPAFLFPDFVLTKLGEKSSVAGRLYSFVAIKHD